MPRLLDMLDKIIQVKFTIVFIATILFLDCYILLRFNNNIIQIDSNSFSKLITIKEILLFLSALTVTFSVAIPAISYLGKVSISVIISLISKRFPSVWSFISRENTNYNDEDMKSIIDVKYSAIINNNYSTYRYCCDEEIKKQNRFQEKYLCKIILVLSFLSCYIADKINAKSSLQHIDQYITSLSWYFCFPAKLLVTTILFALLIYAFEEDENKGKIYYPNNKKS
ncbi:MAG: hypothetical protein CSA18_05185 [Deltaproteobacteria bacterium]|nr:MAG: hypothetical protein CSA18_05185 [Deltaproteobacteria bacterium]